MKRRYLILVFVLALFVPASLLGATSAGAEDSFSQTLCGERLSSYYRTAIYTGGESFSLAVMAPANCTYSISSNSSWLTVTSAPTASGNSTVSFNVASHFNTRPRIGVIVVGGRTHTVHQQYFQGDWHVRTVNDSRSMRITDFTAIQNAGGQMRWWVYRYHPTQGSQFTVTDFGLFDRDSPLPVDFDGDLRADIAVWRNGSVPNEQGYFYVLGSSSGTVSVIPWGVTGDDPNITQDFDGDAKADPAVVRTDGENLVWYISLSATNRAYSRVFGKNTDRPIRGDFDGDFHADIAVYTGNTGTPANSFFIQPSTSEFTSSFPLGLSDIDQVVPGDYNGDGFTDYAVWRTTTGVWYVARGTGVYYGVQWGAPGDIPVPGDYDGDSRTDFAVWRPSSGTFWVRNSNSGDFFSLNWGTSGMKIPVNSMQVR